MKHQNKLDRGVDAVNDLEKYLAHGLGCLVGVLIFPFGSGQYLG
jgi:hypothetical protein